MTTRATALFVPHPFRQVAMHLVIGISSGVLERTFRLPRSGDNPSRIGRRNPNLLSEFRRGENQRGPEGRPSTTARRAEETV